MKATSASGTAILGVITNAANSSPAISGQTNGSGPALRATQTGSNGNAVLGQILSASNPAAAVRGAGSGPRSTPLGSMCTGAPNVCRASAASPAHLTTKPVSSAP